MAAQLGKRTSEEADTGSRARGVEGKSCYAFLQLGLWRKLSSASTLGARKMNSENTPRGSRDSSQTEFSCGDKKKKLKFCGKKVVRKW